MTSPLKIAAALFEAIENKRPECVADLYAHDVEVWHNFSDAAQDKASNVAMLTGLCENVAEIHYDVTERLELDGGRVLQRHVLRCTTDDGRVVRIPACMFITVRDGKIRRIDEYLDTAQAGELQTVSRRVASDS